MSCLLGLSTPARTLFEYVSHTSLFPRFEFVSFSGLASPAASFLERQQRAMPTQQQQPHRRHPAMTLISITMKIDVRVSPCFSLPNTVCKGLLVVEVLVVVVVVVVVVVFIVIVVVVSIVIVVVSFMALTVPS